MSNHRHLLRLGYDAGVGSLSASLAPYAATIGSFDHRDVVPARIAKQKVHRSHETAPCNARGLELADARELSKGEWPAGQPRSRMTFKAPVLAAFLKVSYAS